MIVSSWRVDWNEQQKRRWSLVKKNDVRKEEVSESEWQAAKSGGVTRFEMTIKKKE